MPVQNAIEMDISALDIVFSAVESDQAKILEPKFASDKAVISTASAFRYDDDVPILIPGINSKHAKLIVAKKSSGMERLHYTHSQLHHYWPGDNAKADLRIVRRERRYNDLHASPIRRRPKPGSDRPRYPG